MGKQVILTGRINRGHLPIGGETAKNQALVEAKKQDMIKSFPFKKLQKT